MADFPDVIGILDLPDELVHDTVLRLNYEDILHFCESNTKFNSIICNDRLFWIRKAKMDFNELPSSDIEVLISRDSPDDAMQSYFYLQALMGGDRNSKIIPGLEGFIKRATEKNISYFSAEKYELLGSLLHIKVTNDMRLGVLNVRNASARLFVTKNANRVLDVSDLSHIRRKMFPGPASRKIGVPGLNLVSSNFETYRDYIISELPVEYREFIEGYERVRMGIIPRLKPDYRY